LQGTEDPLDEVPVPSHDAQQDVADLVRGVVHLNAVDDLEALGGHRAPLEREKVLRVLDVDGLEVEIAVRGRKAVCMCARQAHDEVSAVCAFLIQELVGGSSLTLGEIHSSSLSSGGFGAVVPKG